MASQNYSQIEAYANVIKKSRGLYFKAFMFSLQKSKLINISFSFLFSDERDAIQKKTFTKWVNKHLKKVSQEDISRPSLDVEARFVE